ncbi:MAG: DUF3365 domain-containing protein [Syntrophaceae bacterium]|nr:DUF3365 domain-containing protein [Syntrophaceae bacterium]
MIIFIASFPVLVVSSYLILRVNVDREVFENAKVFLFTMESIRKHYGDVTRPAVMKELPERFIVEAMSTSFNARGVAEKVRAEFPHYIFKHISMNPRNPINKADGFEEGIIAKFRADKTLKELKGLVEKGKVEYFYVARPVASKADCLRCHGIPEVAPGELLAKYGSTGAFGWQANQVVGALTAYVPTAIAKKNAQNALILFASFYAAIFFVIMIIIDRVIIGSIIKPIEQFVEVADEISRGKFERDFNVKTKDELKTLSEAFTRMKLSLVKAIDIVRRKQ